MSQSDYLKYKRVSTRLRVDNDTDKTTTSISINHINTKSTICVFQTV